MFPEKTVIVGINVSSVCDCCGKVDVDCVVVSDGIRLRQIGSHCVTQIYGASVIDRVSPAWMKKRAVTMEVTSKVSRLACAKTSPYRIHKLDFELLKFSK
ncbi:MAG: hypothetical protein ACRCZG_03400 [Culicoidibacterales bacterium]